LLAPAANGPLAGTGVAEGYKKKDLTLRAVLYDWRTHNRLELADQNQPLARVPLDVPTKESIELLWLSSPPQSQQAGRIFARVEIYDPADHLLDVVDSPRYQPLNTDEARRLDESFHAQLRRCPSAP
jgi:hypothetical protein